MLVGVGFGYTHYIPAYKANPLMRSGRGNELGTREYQLLVAYEPVEFEE